LCVQSMRMASRWQLFWLLFVSYVFSVYFRKLFSLLLPFIVHDVGLTKDEIGMTQSFTQFGAFAIGKLLFGVASDLVNPSLIVVLGMIGIIISTYTMAISTALWQFLLSGAINGFLQGSGWPSTVKIVRQASFAHSQPFCANAQFQIFTAEEFGRMFTILACTNNVAGFVGPFTLLLPWRQITFVAEILSDVFDLSNPTFIFHYIKSDSLRVSIAATLATVYVAFMWSVVRRSYHYDSNDSSADQSKQQSENNKKTIAKHQNSSFSWRVLLQSEVVWLTAMFYAFTMTSRAIAETWIPIYVSESASEADALQASFVFETGGEIRRIRSSSELLVDHLCAANEIYLVMKFLALKFLQCIPFVF
uniref:MFS domain-containing protein n=1 Tax=Anisakis simplex TaxID=6269 RepID=A0A0M3K9D2_ANISI